jgi:hypothetical protein
MRRRRQHNHDSSAQRQYRHSGRRLHGDRYRHGNRFTDADWNRFADGSIAQVRERGSVKIRSNQRDGTPRVF